MFVCVELSPELYIDHIIKLLILISIGALLMIRVLPMHPPLMFHSFAGGWWMGSAVVRAYIAARSFIW